MVKKYSMWIEKTKTGKYKYSQRYVDPLRSTPGNIIYKKVSVTLTKKTAQAKRQAETMLAKKIDNIVVNAKRGTDISFADLADRYYQNLKDTKQPYNTIKSAFYALRLLKRDIGEETVAKNVTPALVGDLLTRYLYQDNLANKTVKGRKFFLSASYEYGIDHGLVTENPTHKARVKYKDETARKKERIENKYLTDEEARAILAFTKYILNRQDLYDLFKFMLLTGMRFGEVTGLTDKNIFKDQNGTWVAQVNGSNTYLLSTIFNGDARNIKSDRAKTPAGFRKVILNEEAVEICKRNLGKGHSRLFVNQLSNNPWLSVTMVRYFKKITRLLGIEKRVSTHYFRHTYISKLSELHVPLNVIMQQVGQADSKVTKEIYTHVTENEKKNLSQTLSNLKL